jgi:hypothetical protein
MNVGMGVPLFIRIDPAIRTISNIKIMSKVTSVEKAQRAKNKKVASTYSADVFKPCSQDMTICGDCEGNRTKERCPRLKEWLIKREG